MKTNDGSSYKIPCIYAHTHDEPKPTRPRDL